MSLVNSLAIGDADPARAVEGRDKTLKSFHNRWTDPLEGFGELNFLIATDAARVVSPLRSALGVVFTQIPLRPHHVHSGTLYFEYRRDVQERVRVKAAEFGLV